MVLASMPSLKVLVVVQLSFLLFCISVDSSSLLPPKPCPPLAPPKPSPTLPPKPSPTISPPKPTPPMSPPKPSPPLSPPKPSPPLSPPKSSPTPPPPKPSPTPSPPKPSPMSPPPKPSPTPSPPKPSPTLSPPKPSPSLSPPKPSPTLSPPKPSPTSTPPKPSPPSSPPKPSPPLLPPTPSPIERGDLVAVEGYVYCASCKYFRPKKFMVASPLAGAIVKLECKHRKSQVTVTATAGKDGHFLLQPPKEVTTIREAHKCKVFLVSSPSRSCDVPTKLNKGANGAHLKVQRNQPGPAYGYTLYTVGPLAFAADLKTCKKW